MLRNYNLPGVEDLSVEIEHSEEGLAFPLVLHLIQNGERQISYNHESLYAMAGFKNGTWAALARVAYAVGNTPHWFVYLAYRTPNLVLEFLLKSSEERFREIRRELITELDPSAERRKEETATELVAKLLCDRDRLYGMNVGDPEEDYLFPRTGTEHSGLLPNPPLPAAIRCPLWDEICVLPYSMKPGLPLLQVIYDGNVIGELSAAKRNHVFIYPNRTWHLLELSVSGRGSEERWDLIITIRGETSRGVMRFGKGEEEITLHEAVPMRAPGQSEMFALTEIVVTLLNRTGDMLAEACWRGKL